MPTENLSVARKTTLAALFISTQAVAQVRNPSMTVLSFGDRTVTTAISAEGDTVVGFSTNSGSPASHPFAIGPNVDSGAPFDPARCTGVSADGSKVFGYIPGSQAFSWDTKTGDGASFDPGGLTVQTTGNCSADGSTFIGTSIGPNSLVGFSWTPSGTTILTANLHIQHVGISYDGNSIAVINQFFQSYPDRGDQMTPHAALWGLGGLAVLEPRFSYATAISGDGTAVAGFWGDIVTEPENPTFHPTVWGAGSSIEFGPAPTGCGAQLLYATALSANGDIIAGGYSNGCSGLIGNGFLNGPGWIRSPQLGLVTLNNYLPTLGIDLQGWSVDAVRGMSMDGQVLIADGSKLSQHVALWINMRKDTDGDGIDDDWEINGIPYIDATGHMRRYMLAGANPLRKDIYVEVDWMVGYGPSQAALSSVIAAFDQAPVPAPAAPGGLPGITLHLDVADSGIPARNYLVGWTDFETDKSENFGTLGEQNDEDWFYIKKAKAMVYRYCMFSKNLKGSDGHDVLGLGEVEDNRPPHGPRMGGNDLVIGLGDFTPPATVSMDDLQACTFMHELGHTLGLFHGGGFDSQNFNPNHYSCMNYMWVGTRRYAPPGHRALLDYERIDTGSLDELFLIESQGIGGNDPNLAIPYVVPRPGMASLCPPNLPASQFGSCDASFSVGKCIRYARFSGPVDWNNDGIISGLLTPVSADPNNNSICQDIMIGVNEWDLLAYNFRDSVGYSDLAPPPAGSPCPTYEEELFYESLPPAPPIPPCTGVVPQANAPSPATGVSCSLAGTTFQADFAGAGPFTIRWRWRDTSTTPATWVDFNEGTMAHGTQVSGVEAGALSIDHASPADLHSNSVQIAYHLTDRCGLSTDSPESTLLTTCPPTNDACVNAALLPASVTISGTTIDAAQDGVATCVFESGPDVWYTYQPAVSGAVNINTCGSSMDTVLALYTGACGALTQIGCNDDGCGLSSSVTIATTAGQTYFIRVSRFGSGTGNFVVRADPLVPPANDACANAIFLADSAPVNGTNVSSTQDGNATCATSGGDVWYAYRPQTAATVNVSTCGSSFDTVLTVFAGVCGALTEAACNDDSCGVSSSLDYPAAAGQTYLIRVSGYNGRTGSFVVRATGGGGVIPPSCGSADFNCDGDLGTDADIGAFFACISGNCPPPPCTGSADFNRDGDIGTDRDIEAFFRVLGGGPC